MALILFASKIFTVHSFKASQMKFWIRIGICCTKKVTFAIFEIPNFWVHFDPIYPNFDLKHEKKYLKKKKNCNFFRIGNLKMYTKFR